MSETPPSSSGPYGTDPTAPPPYQSGELANRTPKLSPPETTGRTERTERTRVPETEGAESAVRASRVSPGSLPGYTGMARITTPVPEKHRLRKVIITLLVLAVIGGLGYEYQKHSRSAPKATGVASPNGYRTPLNTVAYYLNEQIAYETKQTPGNLIRIKSVTCPQDIAAGKLSPVSGKITSYKLVNRAATSEHAHVDTTIFTDTNTAGTSLTVPMVKDAGKWLVCFTSTVATGGTLPSSAST